MRDHFEEGKRGEQEGRKGGGKKGKGREQTPPKSISGYGIDHDCTFYNINTDDNVYGAVIMANVITRIHSVHSMNAEQSHTAADPETK